MVTIDNISSFTPKGYRMYTIREVASLQTLLREADKLAACLCVKDNHI